MQRTAFPDEVDYRTDVRVLGGRHWPTVISQTDFQHVTGEPEFPLFLAGRVKDGKLEYSQHFAGEVRDHVPGLL